MSKAVCCYFLLLRSGVAPQRLDLSDLSLTEGEAHAAACGDASAKTLDLGCEGKAAAGLETGESCESSLHSSARRSASTFVASC